MSTAFSAFAARRRREPASEDLASAELENAVDAALLRARQAWPSLAVDDAHFGDELAARAAREPSLATSIGRMSVGDLYFVLACARGDTGALSEFEKRFLPDVVTAVQRMGFAASAVDETLQVLRTTLLVAGEHGPPRILEFGARGQLRGWLRVVATRIAFRLARPARKNVPLDESLGEEGRGDLELDFLKKKYGATFHVAFREALAGLPVQDRVLLKQRFAHHATVVELGALHGVHASTISRWVTDTRERLVAATREGMMKRLRVPEPEISSILRLIHSEMDITLSTYKDSDARDVSG